jgi:hypothetical protein
MATRTTPHSRAHDIAVRTPIGKIARELQSLLGQKYTALLAGIRDPKAVGEWARDERTPHSAVAERLRCAFLIVCLLREAEETSETIQAWFTGMNPYLDDRSPIFLIREDQAALVLRAARAFIAQG